MISAEEPIADTEAPRTCGEGTAAGDPAPAAAEGPGSPPGDSIAARKAGAVEASPPWTGVELEDPEGQSETRGSHSNPSREATAECGGPKEALQARRGCCRLSRCATGCILCLASLVALCGLSAVLLRPTTPRWELKTMDIDPKQLQGLIQAITDPTFHSNLPIGVHTTVSLWNGNFVASRAGTGHYTVSLGSHLLARAQTEPMPVPAHGNTLCRSHASGKLTPELGKVLMATVLESRMKLRPLVEGTVPVKLLGMTLQVGVHCLVEVDVVKLLQDPNNSITDHNCTYKLMR